MRRQPTARGGGRDLPRCQFAANRRRSAGPAAPGTAMGAHPLQRVYLSSAPLSLRPAGGSRGDRRSPPPAAATTHRDTSLGTAAASPAGARSALSGYLGGRGLARDVTAGGGAGRARGAWPPGRVHVGWGWRVRGVRRPDTGRGLWVQSTRGKHGRRSAPRPGTAWGIPPAVRPRPTVRPRGQPCYRPIAFGNCCLPVLRCPREGQIHAPAPESWGREHPSLRVSGGEGSRQA